MLVRIPQCEYCGGTKFENENGMTVCSGCRKKYTFEEVQQLPTVEVESQAEDMASAETIVRQATMTGDWDKAIQLFEREKSLFGGWEPTLYSAYCKAMQNIKQPDMIVSSAKEFSDELQNAVFMAGQLVGSEKSSEEEQTKLLSDIYKRINEVYEIYFAMTYKDHVNPDSSGKKVVSSDVFFKKFVAVIEILKGFVTQTEFTPFSLNVKNGFMLRAAKRAEGDVCNIASMLQNEDAGLFDSCQKLYSSLNGILKLCERKEKEIADGQNDNTTVTTPPANSTVNNNPAPQKAMGKQGCLVVLVALIIVTALCLFV